MFKVFLSRGPPNVICNLVRPRMTRYVIWAAPEIGYICNLARPPKTIYVILPVHLFPLPPMRYNMPLGMKARIRML